MEFADSHVLITGGAGLVGSHLAEAILDAGGTVRVADDLSKGDRARVPERATFLKADVSDPDTVAEVVTGELDAVCHLAAYTDTNCEDDRELFETNTAMTHLLLEQMRAVGVDRFVFTS